METQTKVLEKVFYNRSGCQCLSCGIFKPWASFDRLQASPTGYSFTCNQCKIENPKMWYGKGRASSKVSPGVLAVDSLMAA